MVLDFLVANTDCEEDMSAADNGLVGVVRVEMQATPNNDSGENVAGRGNALSRCPPDSKGKNKFS